MKFKTTEGQCVVSRAVTSAQRPAPNQYGSGPVTREIGSWGCTARRERSSGRSCGSSRKLSRSASPDSVTQSACPTGHGSPGTGRCVRVSGDHTAGATPVPIPNTEVKPRRADVTALATAWESRSSPGYKTSPAFVRGFVFVTCARTLFCGGWKVEAASGGRNPDAFYRDRSKPRLCAGLCFCNLLALSLPKGARTLPEKVEANGVSGDPAVL